MHFFCVFIKSAIILDKTMMLINHVLILILLVHHRISILLDFIWVLVLLVIWKFITFKAWQIFLNTVRIIKLIMSNHEVGVFNNNFNNLCLFGRYKWK